MFHSLRQQFVKRCDMFLPNAQVDRSSVSCQNAFHTEHAKSRPLNGKELSHRPTSAARHPCRMPESLAPACCCCYYYDYPRLDVQGARCTLDKVPGCPPLEREEQPGRYSWQHWRAMSSNCHTPPPHSKLVEHACTDAAPRKRETVTSGFDPLFFAIPVSLLHPSPTTDRVNEASLGRNERQVPSRHLHQRRYEEQRQVQRLER